MPFSCIDAGLVAIYRPNTGLINRLPVQDCQEFREALRRFRAQIVAEFDDEDEDTLPEVIQEFWATSLAAALSDQNIDENGGAVLAHVCGLGLLTELDHDNVIVTVTPDGAIAFQEIEGTTGEAYTAVDRWMSEQHSSVG